MISGKRIAITGITGIVGLHLSNLLSDVNDVYGLVKDDPGVFNLSGITKIYGDVSNKKDVEYFIQKAKPDYVFHLAARTQALESLDIPYETFYTNSVGTLNVLESVRKLCPNIGAVVVASSDKSYGELESDSYTENHPLNGTYPYDASKSITDIICKSYRKTYELPVATIRSCNVYGIGDLNRGRILPALIESFLSGKPFEIRNGGFDKREYIHAEDSARAYIEIAKYINNSGKEGSFNVASGEVFSVLDIVNMFEEAVGEKINKVFTGGKTKEIGSQVLDFSLIIKETNWTPEKKIKDNIPKIIDWYREQKKQLEKSGF